MGCSFSSAVVSSSGLVYVCNPILQYGQDFSAVSDMRYFFRVVLYYSCYTIQDYLVFSSLCQWPIRSCSFLFCQQQELGWWKQIAR